MAVVVAALVAVGCSDAADPQAQDESDRKATKVLQQWQSNIEASVAAHGFARTAGGVGLNMPSAPVSPTKPMVSSILQGLDGSVAILVFEDNGRSSEVPKLRRWYRGLGFRSEGRDLGTINGHVQRGSLERDVLVWQGSTPGRYALVLRSYPVGHEGSLQLSALARVRN